MRRLPYPLLVLTLGLTACEPPPGDRMEGPVAQKPLTEEEIAERLVQEARRQAILAVDSINGLPPTAR